MWRRRFNHCLWLVLACGLSGLCSCGRKPAFEVVTPALPVGTIDKVWRLDSGTDLSETVTLSTGDEHYIILEFSPIDNIPIQLNGQQTPPPRCWSYLAVCYPEGGSINSIAAVKFSVARLSDFKPGECVPATLAAGGPQASSPRYAGVPVRGTQPPPDAVLSYQPANGPKQVRGAAVVNREFVESVIPLWTFLGPTHKEPGSYKLEILAFPFALVNDDDIGGICVSLYSTDVFIR